MALDFPSNPVNGQIYTVGTRSWTWSNTGGFWQATSVTTGYTGSAGVNGYSGSNGYTGSAGIGYTGSKGDPTGYTGSQGVLGYTGSAGTGGGGASVVISDSAPASANTGDLWYNSAVGETYIYYSDGDSSQWVTVTAIQSPIITPPVNALSQQFTANGTQTTFSLSASVQSQNNVMVSVNGLVQAPVLHYTISSSTLSFTFTPPAGTLVEIRNLENGTGAIGYTGSAGAGYTGSAGSIGTIGYTGSSGAGSKALSYTYSVLFGG